MTTRTALVEIDLQGWILAAFPSAGVPERARAVRDRCRAAGALVVCSRYLSRDPADPLRHDPTGAGASFHPLAEPEQGDLVLTKYGRDLADNPDLDANLRCHGVTDVVLTGVATEHGVALAARSLLALGYHVSVVAAACAGASEAAHTQALVDLAQDGVRVVDLEWTPAPTDDYRPLIVDGLDGGALPAT